MKSNLQYQYPITETQEQSIPLHVFRSTPRQRLMSNLAALNYKLAFCVSMLFIYNGISYFVLSGLESVLHKKYTVLNESIRSHQELESSYSRESSWQKLYSTARTNNMEKAVNVKTINVGI